MAIEIKNGANINFGTFGAAARVTHLRIRRGRDDGQPVVKALAAPVSVGQNEQFQVDEGDLKVKYPRGDLTDAHMREALKDYWGINNAGTTASTGMEIDAMTSSTVVVNVTGYGQRDMSDWDVATVAD